MQEPEFCKKNIWVLPNIWVLGEPEFCSKRSKKKPGNALYTIADKTGEISSRLEFWPGKKLKFS